jgi:hypothetical protein
MLTEERWLQPENAQSLMDVTLEGMLTEERRLQLENALSPMDVTPEGIA